MAPRDGSAGQGRYEAASKPSPAPPAPRQPKSHADALMQNFVALARPADPARPAPAEPRTPTLPTRLARGGAATPVPVDVLVLSSPAPSSSSGLTYQDAAPAAVNRPPQPNPFALAGQAKRAADQALLLAPRPRQPAPGAPAPPPFGLPPSAFSNQPLGASALVPPSRHNSLLSFGSSGAGVGVAPRSTNRQQRELLRTLRSDGGGSSASSATGNGARAGAAGKENVEPARRRPVLAAPRTAGALEPETPKRQRTRVVEWRNDVQRAASVDEGRSSGGVDGAVRVDERVRPRGGAAVGAAGMQAVSKGHGALGAQAQQPRRTAGTREKGEKGEQAGSEDDDERARPAKKVRQRRRAADEPKQRRRSSVSSGAEAAASAPPRRSGRTKRERAPAAAAAAAAGAADETGVSTLDLVAMLPRRAKRFARRGRLSSQDEDEGEDEDEATDYDDPPAKRKAEQRKPAPRKRKTVGKAASRKTTRRGESSGGSDDSESRRIKEEKRRHWENVDAFELEIQKTV